MKREIAPGYFVLVDAKDAHWLDRRPWHLRQSQRNQTYYVASGGDYLHRKILGLNRNDGVIVDHKNRNGLDCRRRNLRPTTQSHNMAAALIKPSLSGFRGVRRRKNRYRATLVVNRKNVLLGNFDTAEEAARAYDTAAVAQYGEFARTNFGGQHEQYQSPHRNSGQAAGGSYQPGRHRPVRLRAERGGIEG